MNRTLVVSKSIVSVKFPMDPNPVTVTGMTSVETPGTELVTFAAMVTGASAAFTLNDSISVQINRSADFLNFPGFSTSYA
jgi:hypothetical protein